MYAAHDLLWAMQPVIVPLALGVVAAADIPRQPSIILR